MNRCDGAYVFCRWPNGRQLPRIVRRRECGDDCVARGFLTTQKKSKLARFPFHGNSFLVETVRWHTNNKCMCLRFRGPNDSPDEITPRLLINSKPLLEPVELRC